jgi:hypothetical protein
MTSAYKARRKAKKRKLYSINGFIVTELIIYE